jgi:hypothetical protein
MCNLIYIILHLSTGLGPHYYKKKKLHLSKKEYIYIYMTRAAARVDDLVKYILQT